MPRESGAQFKRSGGHAKETAIRFLVANDSWCDTEQKKAIIICGEVLSERGLSETIEKSCTTTLLSIVDDLIAHCEELPGLEGLGEEVS